MIVAALKGEKEIILKIKSLVMKISVITVVSVIIQNMKLMIILAMVIIPG